MSFTRVVIERTVQAALAMGTSWRLVPLQSPEAGAH